MKKKLLLLVIFLINFRLVNSKYINKINIIGNIQYNQDFYKNILDINTDEPFTDEIKESIIKTLKDSGFVKNVIVSFNNKIITVKINENPTIGKITFNGNKKLKEDTIDKESKLKIKQVFSEKNLQKDLAFIKAFYSQQGFYNTTIEHKIEKLENNSIEIIFNIKESKKSKIEKIIFKGNEKISSFDLRNTIYSKIYNPILFWRKSHYFCEEMLNYDEHLLQDFYKNKGFLAFKILDKKFILNEETNNFTLMFEVEESIRFTVAEMSISNEIDNFDDRTIVKIVKKNIKINDFIQTSAIGNLDNEINKYLADNSYYYVEVNINILQKDEKSVKVEVGLIRKKRQYLDKIIVKNNIASYDKTIRENLFIHEGDFLNDKIVDYSIQKVNFLPFIANAEKKILDSDFSNKKILEIALKEDKKVSLSLSGGYSTIDSWSIGTGIGHNNIFGRGIDFNINLNYAFTSKSIDFDTTIYTPNIFNTNNKNFFRIYVNVDNNSLKKDSKINYNDIDWGFTNNIRFPINNLFSYSLGYNLSISKIDYLTEINQVRTEEERLYKTFLPNSTQYLSEITNNISYEGRRLVKGNYDGLFVNLFLNVAGLFGNKFYIKGVFHANYYFTIHSAFILKFEMKLGKIGSFNKKYPLYMNDGFHLGGNSMRGFKPNGAGIRLKRYDKNSFKWLDPDNESKSFASTNLIYFNSELKIAPKFLIIWNMYFVLFLNAGMSTGFENNNYINKDMIVDSGRMRIAGGVSFVWETPLGFALRFDLAKAFKKEKYDAEEKFRFGLDFGFGKD